MGFGDTYKFVVQGSYFGQVCQNIFWYTQANTGGGLADVQDLCDNIAGLWCEGFADIQNAAFTWNSCGGLNWINGLEAVSTPTNIPGTRIGGALPPWFVFNVSWNRQGAGYNYPNKRVSGLDESTLEGGGINGATVAIINTIANAMCIIESTNGVIYALRTFNPYPELGQNPYAIPGTRFQEMVTARGVTLGTQKTRK